MSRRLQFAIIAGLLIVPIVLGRSASAAEPVQVAVDQATLIKLPEKVGTIIVGNPLIADVAVQAGGTVIITGKGYGATNLVALDRQGNVLMERLVQVQGPRDATVVVYRGVQRETYSCAPDCERRITLGDTQDYFIGNMTQTSARNQQAQGGGAQQPR